MEAERSVYAAAAFTRHRKTKGGQRLQAAARGVIMPYVKEDFTWLYPFKWIIPSACWATVVLLFGALWWFPTFWLWFVWALAILYGVISARQVVRAIRSVLGIKAALSRNDITQEMRANDGPEVLETFLRSEPDCYHVICVVNYKEPLLILRATLGKLAEHYSAKRDHIICMAMEMAETEAVEKAEQLIGEFKLQFRGMYFTLHEKQEGELRGKLSNADWAFVHASENLAEMNIPDAKVLMTAIDADAEVPELYFEEISRMWKEMGQDTKRKVPRENIVFGAPGLLERNCMEVPFFTRAMDSCWMALAMQQMGTAIGFGFPISNFTVSLDLLQRINFLDTHEDAIADDSHVILKAFFKTNGMARFQAVWAPINMLNLNEGNYFKTLWARFIQAKRHFRGQHDFSYGLKQMLTTRPCWLTPFVLIKLLETHMMTVLGPLYMMGAIPFIQLMSWINLPVMNFNRAVFMPNPDVVIAFGASLLVAYITLIVSYELVRRDCNRRLYHQESPSVLWSWQYIALIPDTFAYVIIPHMLTSTFSLIPCIDQGGFKVSAKVIVSGEPASVLPALPQGRKDADAISVVTVEDDTSPANSSGDIVDPKHEAASVAADAQGTSEPVHRLPEPLMIPEPTPVMAAA